MITVKVSPEEKSNGEWSVENLRIILEAMHTDGIAVLEGLIDPEHLDQMNEFMTKDAVRIRETTEHLNFGTENIQQGPPLHEPSLVFDDFLVNKLLLEPVLHILGPGAKWDFISGNTALPNSTERQPVHSDDKCDYLAKTYYVVANIPMIDIGPFNGATEVWPGTHKLRSLSNYSETNAAAIDETVLEERRGTNPPIQPRVKKGSIIIRDLMLWHCGTPNPSNDIRCMPALGFSAKWWKNDARFKLPSEEMQRDVTAKAAECGIIARSKVVDNFNVQKDLHDFNLNEDPNLQDYLD